MRIRKNAKVSPLLYSDYALNHEALLQTHLCQLNQSPWDVITFPPSDASSSTALLLPRCPPLNQGGGDDSFMGNGSFGDSIGPVESVASMKNSFHGDEDMKEEDAHLKWSFSGPFGFTDRVLDHHQQRFMKTKEDTNDGKGGWQCRKKAKEGHSSGECYSPSIRSSNNLNSKKSDKLSDTKRRPRHKKVLASSSTSNPYEFYYYSGFGPLWGKRRGPSKAEAKKADSSTMMIKNLEMDEPMVEEEEAATYTIPITTFSSSSHIDEEEFNYVENQDKDDAGKKRGRKPIKARSLKSLM